jgi:hypothetical protein
MSTLKYYQKEHLQFLLFCASHLYLRLPGLYIMEISSFLEKIDILYSELFCSIVRLCCFYANSEH